MNQKKWEEIKNKLEGSFEFIHRNLDDFKIKEKVDEMGINGYINYCAALAGITGATAGLGGGVTMLIGLPADLLNTVAQQFRVTLAVIYHRTGRYKLTFSEFMKIAGLSLGVEVGFKGINYITIRVAEEIGKRLLARGFGRVIPLVGGLVGLGLNVAFIKSIGSALLAMEDSIFIETKQIVSGT